jgi:hypothetical protein
VSSKRANVTCLIPLALRVVRSICSTVDSLLTEDFGSSHEPAIEHRQPRILMCTSSRNTCVTYIPPAYPPRPRMPSACTAVMRRRFSISLIFAVNCASCACRCESWRVLEAEVGTVDNREVLWVCVWPGVRGLSDIFAFYERIRWFRMRRFTVIRLSCAKGQQVFLLTSKERVLFT